MTQDVAGLREELVQRGVPLAIVSVAGLALLAGMLAEAPPAVLLAIAAAPLVLVVGHRIALGALVAALVVRALLDGAGNQLATAGVAAGLVGLAVLVLLRAPQWVLASLLVSAGLLVSAWSGAPTHGAAETYGEAVRVISCLAVVVITVNAPGTLTFHRVLHGVQLVGFVPAALAIVQLATGSGTMISGVMRSSGTLAQSNSAALFFALCNVATLAAVLDHPRRRWPHLGLLALFLGAQVSTGSVGGLVACVVMIAVYTFVSAQRRLGRIVLGTVGGALVVYAAVTSDVGTRRLTELTAGTGDNSVTWRFHAWDKVLDAWRANPVLGNGIGATQSDSILAGNIPHNEYVRLLAEGGVVGLALVLGLGLWLTARFVGRLRSGGDRPSSALALAVIAGLAVNALAANTALYTVAFYLALFMVAGSWRVGREARADDA